MINLTLENPDMTLPDATHKRPPTPKIFLSYAREDARDIALRLHEDLTAAGHDAWLDLSEIGAGASWSRDIELAIEAAEVVLVLLTNGSYVSEICRAEQQRALRKGKRVIPLMVQPDADRPLYLENLNYLDFTNPARYKDTFQDLLGYIATGHMPKRLTASAQRGAGAGSTRITHAPAPAPASSMPQKRDARAFRRYLADLRDEPWLGARYWWPYFLFYFADIHEIAAVLTNGLLLPPIQMGGGGRGRRTGRWDHQVRLYFRPRTPDLFISEGVRPAAGRGGGHMPVPVYLLFDLEALLCSPETRFSEGDVATLEKTYKSATAFRDLPFDLIYHDSWFRNDERDEIMNARRSQVLVPGALKLDHLQHIWCRSSAEYDMLRALLPEEAWARWRDKITARADYNLFNRRWLYVDEVLLTPDEARFRFSPCDLRREECGRFQARVEIEGHDGSVHVAHSEGIDGNDDLLIRLNGRLPTYRARLYLDEALVYLGHFSDEPEVW